MQQDGLNEDVLFLACTRPAMWQGVPLESLAINGMVTSIIFVVMGNPFYLLIGVAIHYATRAMISFDYNMFSILRLWSMTKARARNTDQWGGSSVSPLPLTKARRKNGNCEVRIHV